MAGLAFVPMLGLQNDEALFASGIFEPLGAAEFRCIFGHKLPLMLMTYLGGLKSWLYTPVFNIWTPSPASIRLPMLFAGTAALGFFFLFFRRAAGPRAAVIGAALLATDPVFLLTAVFDWGPVALQHLLLGAALFLLLRWHQRKYTGWTSLAAGFFLLGLALWNKAIFSWMLAGLAAATLLVFPRELLRAFNLRRAAVAFLSFALGALPLIIYNAKYRLETFRSNTAFDASDVPGRARLVRYTLEGSALFGWLTADDYEVAAPRHPRTAAEKVSAFLAGIAGHPRSGLGFYAFVAALALLPFLWRAYGWNGPVRAIAFALVFLAVAWSVMALTRGAGGGVHHVILLWPFPALVVAAAFAAAGSLVRRGTVAVALAVPLVAASNTLVLNEYYHQAVRNGGSLNWTDAIFPLAREVREFPAEYVFVADWGTLDSLRLLSSGRLPLRLASDPTDAGGLRSQLSTAHLFIGHTPGNEFFPGATAKLEAAAAGLGYRRELLRAVADSRGKPIFEIYRFTR